MVKVPWALRALPPVAYRAWFTPPPLGRRAAAADRTATEGVEAITIPGTELEAFEIGSGPLVLALHGWGGRAAQMIPLARRLADDAFHVVAIDLPGRAGGTTTDIEEVAAAIREAIESLGRPYAMVTHSFGAMTARLAMGAEDPPLVVMLAPALTVADVLETFGERARLLPWTRASLHRRLWSWGEGMVPAFEASFPDQLPGAEILIVHDPDDDDTPFGRSAELAASHPSARLVSAPGVGHHGILVDDTVHEAVAAFLSRRAVHPLARQRE